MAYDYVNQFYGLTVEVGQRVTLKSPGCEPRQGVVVGKRAYDHYVHVRFDGRKFDVPVHPMDLEYPGQEVA